MNRPYVTSTKWRELSNEKIVALFDRFFDDVAIQPNAEIVAEMRLLGTGTLELLEDRTASSVYRIRDTGTVFQIEAENGECWSYDDYGDYQQDPPMDELVTCYVPEPRTYEVIDQVNGVVIVRRNKPPRFKARYTLVTGDIELFDKEDPFDAFSLAKYARQMAAVVSRFLKKKIR